MDSHSKKMIKHFITLQVLRGFLCTTAVLSFFSLIGFAGSFEADIISFGQMMTYIAIAGAVMAFSGTAAHFVEKAIHKMWNQTHAETPKKGVHSEQHN